MNFAPGQILLDSYEVIRPGSSEGLRETYHARDQSDNSTVVLRVLSNPDEEGVQDRFQQDVLSLTRVDHSNVVPIKHYGLIDGRFPCLVLAATSGPTLAEFIIKQGPMEWHDAVHMVCQILEGLGSLHQQGVIHRDVSTDAIQLLHGDKGMPLITNFGIAQGQSAYDTKIQNGWVAGNPGFMSPEQLYGLALDERSDVYSAALVLYSCVTGQSMGVTSARDALEQRVMNRLPPMNAGPRNSKPPVALKDLISGAMEPDPARRPQDTSDFAKKLRAIAKDAGHTSRPTTGKRKDRSSNRIKVSTAQPKAGWKPPSWAKQTDVEGDPKKRPVSARLQTVGADDIISSAVGESAPPLPPEAPPPLPVEEYDDIFEDDILTEEFAEEFDLDILSEETVVHEPGPPDMASADLELESAPPLESGDFVIDDDDDDDDDFAIPEAVQALNEPTPAASQPATSQAQAVIREPRRETSPPTPAPADTAPPAMPRGNSEDETDELPGFRMQRGNATAHAVIVVRVPPKQLRLPSEVRWLREQIGKHSHGVTVGQNMWVGTIVTDTKAEAETLANQAKSSMLERYGADFKAEWTPVSEDFEVNSSNVLPNIVEGLIHYLSQ